MKKLARKLIRLSCESIPILAFSLIALLPFTPPTVGRTYYLNTGLDPFKPKTHWAAEVLEVRGIWVRYQTYMNGEKQSTEWTDIAPVFRLMFPLRESKKP